MQSQLQEAVNAIKSGNTDRAKQLLADVLKHNPQDENAWLWMTRCLTSNDEKRYCFERVLKINPQNQHAVEGIRRLNNPVSATPQPKATQQQSGSQRKPKQSNLLFGILALLGLLWFACIFAAVTWMFPDSTASNVPSQQNNPIPTAVRRPNYRQMLEDNGFVYYQNDAEGDPIYVSPCGCVVTVKPDYLGFAAYVTDDDCPIEDMGRIISIMYPPEVLDFIVANMDVVSKDTIAQGTAAEHEIVMDFDRVDYKLVIIIRDR
ncbi:MAG: hypothetical protein CNIPEHKO_00805 [Anaerolineales bacterium]|nr:hypothetical protein [Anaerolineales bacterium]